MPVMDKSNKSIDDLLKNRIIIGETPRPGIQVEKRVFVHTPTNGALNGASEKDVILSERGKDGVIITLFGTYHSVDGVTYDRSYGGTLTYYFRPVDEDKLGLYCAYVELNGGEVREGYHRPDVEKILVNGAKLLAILKQDREKLKKAQ
jgi:hypothetical protein